MELALFETEVSVLAGRKGKKGREEVGERAEGGKGKKLQ